MTADSARSLLHAYVDGELDPASALEVKAQIENSPELQRELALLSTLQNALQNRATRHSLPPRLTDRAFAALPVTVTARNETPGEISRGWRTVAIGSALATVALFFWGLGLFAPSDIALQEVVSAHVRSLMADHLTDLAASERHVVKPWLSSRLDFAPPVHDLAQEGYLLVGARLDYLGGQPAAAIVYRYRQHPINVFVWPSGAGVSQSVRISSYRGYNAAHFGGGGMACWTISDLNSADLSRFSELLRRRFTENN
jgi:anti-sigma factor RsiW